MESRKIWKPVTDAIIGKQFGDATKHKQVIEQTQRDRAAERKKNGTEYVQGSFTDAAVSLKRTDKSPFLLSDSPPASLIATSMTGGPS